MNSANFLWPVGPIRESWFTVDQSAPEVIAQWITLAEEAGATTAAEAQPYIEMRAYQMMADRFGANPIHSSRDGDSESYAIGQLNHWKELAEKAQLRWESITGMTTVKSNTTTADNTFVW